MNSEEEKRKKYLQDVERLRRIREQAKKRDPGHYRDTAGERRREKGAAALPAGDGLSDGLKTDAGRSRARTKKRKKAKNILRILYAAVFLFLLGYGVLNLMATTGGKESGFYTVAVFGVDSRDGNLEKGALADVNMIVSLDRSNGNIRLISVYRDTYVQIDENGKFHKFNEAYFKGGPKQALWTMKHNLGIEPDDYVTFNWKAVIDAINIMGGVDIEITEPEFVYINSFITETVESTGIGSVHLKHAGMNHLDGVQAVAYARLRLMDTDYNRTERQRKVVSLLVDKIKAADLKKRYEVVTSVLPETKTSITVDDLLPFAKNARRFHIGATGGFPFERDTATVDKKNCVIAVTLESNVKALHAFLFDDMDYRPSSSVREISKKIVKKTGLEGSGEIPEAVTDTKGSGGVGTKP